MLYFVLFISCLKRDIIKCSKRRKLNKSFVIYFNNLVVTLAISCIQLIYIYMRYFISSRRLKILKLLQLSVLLVFYEKKMFLEFQTEIFKNKKVIQH